MMERDQAVMHSNHADHDRTARLMAFTDFTLSEPQPPDVAAGEMIRFAGVSLVSAVLVGADKSDESLGLPRVPAPYPASAV